MLNEPDTAPVVIETEPSASGSGSGWDRTDAVVFAWLNAKTKSNATRQSYAASIGAPAHVRRALPGGPAKPRPVDRLTWLGWAAAHDVDPLSPRRDQLDMWLSATGTAVASGHLSASTRTHRYRAVSALLGWAARRDYIAPVALPDGDDRRAHGVTGQADAEDATTALPAVAVDALLWAGEHDNRTVSNKPGAASPEQRRARSRVLLALLLGAGLRVSELVGLDVTHYWRTDPHGIAHIKVKGKGGKVGEQSVPVWAANVVDEYLRRWRIGSGSGEIEVSTGVPRRAGGVPLVTGDRGQRLNRATVNGTVARLACLPSTESEDPEEAGYAAVLARLPRTADGCPSVHPHQLRHATAHRVLDAGGDVEDVRRFLRHESINTSQTYLESRERRTDRVAAMLG